MLTWRCSPCGLAFSGATGVSSGSPVLAFSPVHAGGSSPGARNVYHQLLMSSLLMDPKYKKLFAIQFAKVRNLRVCVHVCVKPLQQLKTVQTECYTLSLLT